MKPATAALLARWREARAAPVPGVPGASPPPGTGANPQKSNIVPGVPAVPGENDNAGGAQRDAWALAFVAEAAALVVPEPVPVAAPESATGAAGAGRPAGAPLPPATAEATLASFQAPALPAAGDWRALPYEAERGTAFRAARAAPGACPYCAGNRWWRPEGEPADGAARCLTCHPPPPGLAIAMPASVPGDAA